MICRTTLFLVCAFEIGLILFASQHAHSADYVYDKVDHVIGQLLYDLQITDWALDVITGGASIISESVKDTFNAITSETPGTNTE